LRRLTVSSPISSDASEPFCTASRRTKSLPTASAPIANAPTANDPIATAPTAAAASLILFFCAISHPEEIFRSVIWTLKNDIHSALRFQHCSAAYLLAGGGVSVTSTFSNGSAPVSTTVTVFVSAGTPYLAQVLSVFLGGRVIASWFGAPCPAATGLPPLSFISLILVLPSAPRRYVSQERRYGSLQPLESPASFCGAAVLLRYSHFTVTTSGAVRVTSMRATSTPSTENSWTAIGLAASGASAAAFLAGVVDF